MGEQVQAQFNPATYMSDQMRASLEASFQPVNDLTKQLTKNMREILKPTFEVIKKIQEKHEEGKDIRGAIVTDIIDLDELLEEIILERYVKEDLRDEFSRNLLNSESCSTAFKMKIVNRSGLLNDTPGLKTNLQTLIEIRNTVAHSKYRPTIQTVEVLHKKKISNLKSLKDEFDKIYADTIKKLEGLSK